MKQFPRLSSLLVAVVLIIAGLTGAVSANENDGSAALYVRQSTLTTCSAPGAGFDGSVPLINSITVPEGGVVTDVNVFADVSHANLVEVELSVVHDEAATMLILDRCASDANISATFDDQSGGFDCSARIGGTFAPPDGELSVFTGEPSAGVWNLVAHDVNENGANGTLNQWCLSLSYIPDATVTPPIDDEPVTDGRWLPGDDRINPHPAAEVALYCRDTGIHAYDRNGQFFFFVSYDAIDAAVPSEDMPVATSADDTTTLYRLENGLIAVQRIQGRGDHNEYYQFFWDACPPTYKLTQVYLEDGELLVHEVWP